MGDTKLSARRMNLAVRLLIQRRKSHTRAVESYERDCRQAAREGFRPHYCFHGVNLWTDYDPICGQCEDGYGTRWDYLREARDVLDAVHRAHNETRERMAVLSDAYARFPDFPAMDCSRWAFAPIAELEAQCG